MPVNQYSLNEKHNQFVITSSSSSNKLVLHWVFSRRVRKGQQFVPQLIFIL